VLPREINFILLDIIKQLEVMKELPEIDAEFVRRAIRDRPTSRHLLKALE